jgi:hypothetical protein
MEKPNPIFETHYKDYLADIANIDLPARSATLDISVEAEGKRAVIPYFGRDCRVSSEGIADPQGKRPDYGACLLMLKYLLLCPPRLPVDDEWVNYRDLKDSGPLTVYFNDNVLNVLSRRYSGRKTELEAAAADLDGRPPANDYPYDVAVVFRPLPRVPVLLLFNDADDEFPAQASVLFERRAERFLDAECLAVLGGALVEELKQKEKAAAETNG